MPLLSPQTLSPHTLASAGQRGFSRVMPDATASRSHLAPFLEGPGPYLVIARNAITIAGVWVLGWSAQLAALLLWCDGVAALGMLCLMVMRARLRLGLEAVRKASSWAGLLFVFAFFGVPYWMMFAGFNAWFFPKGFWSEQFADPWVVVALTMILIGNAIEEARRGLVGMSEKGIRLVSNGQFTLHWVRGGIVVLLLVLLPLPVQYFIVLVTVALSYLEIYPRRTLRLFGREHEIDDDTPGLSD